MTASHSGCVQERKLRYGRRQFPDRWHRCAIDQHRNNRYARVPGGFDLASNKIFCASEPAKPSWHPPAPVRPMRADHRQHHSGAIDRCGDVLLEIHAVRDRIDVQENLLFRNLLREPIIYPAGDVGRVRPAVRYEYVRAARAGGGRLKLSSLALGRGSLGLDESSPDAIVSARTIAVV